MSIEQFIEQYRLANPSATYGDIADVLGLSRPFLSQILNRHREPGREVCERIYLMTGGAVTLESWMARSNPTAA